MTSNLQALITNLTKDMKDGESLTLHITAIKKHGEVYYLTSTSYVEMEKELSTMRELTELHERMRV